MNTKQVADLATERETTKMVGDRLMDIEAVRQMLRVSKRTVYRLMSEGVFPKPVRIGSLSRWFESEVQAFLQALKEGPRELRFPLGEQFGERGVA